MMKLVVLALGLVIGFGAGVWWGVKNPEQAQSLAQEEQRFLEEQLRIARETKERLDQIAASQRNRTSGSSLLPGGGGAGSPDPQIVKLRDDQEEQIEKLEDRLEQIK